MVDNTKNNIFQIVLSLVLIFGAIAVFFGMRLGYSRLGNNGTRNSVSAIQRHR